MKDLKIVLDYSKSLLDTGKISKRQYVYDMLSIAEEELVMGHSKEESVIMNKLKGFLKIWILNFKGDK